MAFVVSSGTVGTVFGTGGISIALTPNTPPSQIAFKESVVLSTLDLTTNTNVTEGYVVSGPSAVGVTVIPIAGTNKAVIPLSTATGNGAPYLKVHYPTNPTGNTVYVTYCVASSKMADGYYDYQTGVPSTYFTALRTWINAGGAIAATPTVVRTKALKFSFYGAATNQFQNAVTFYISFQGTFTTNFAGVSLAGSGTGTGGVATGGF